MQENLGKIFEMLNAQDARIKALETELEVCGVDVGDVVDVLHGKLDGERYDDFSARHRAKMEPYLGIMDKLEGGDSFRAIYDSANEMAGTEGYDEDAYVDNVLKIVLETITALKEIVPTEAQPALETAEAALQEAAIENDQGKGEGEIKDPSNDLWDEETLMKEQQQGKQFYR